MYKIKNNPVSDDDATNKKYVDNTLETKQDKTDNTLETTDKTVVGAINEVNDNQLDTVGFSSDYKNIIFNRKNGLNPYIIPISSIIHNAKLTELNDIDATDIGNGKTLIYDSTTQKHKYVDSTGTDELVKMDSTTDAKYLSDLIDKSTIINDNGTLKVKKLDGQEVTIAEINHLKGLTMNVVALVNAFANGGVKVWGTPVNTYADLSTLDRSTFIDGISYIVYVLTDETHSGAKTTYLCDKTSSTFFGNADSQRNFVTNPIDLANEVTGKLGVANIDVDALWSLLTINDTYKTLTTKDEVFGTHGAKALYDELVAYIGNKANSSDLTTHTGDANVHITTAERTAWNNKANDSEVIKKTDKTTTINKSSTDDQYPTAKAVYTAITNQIAAFNLLKTVYPVGSIYINTTDVNPSTIFGFGTWERVAQNMTLWGSSADGEVGTTKSAGLPNITGEVGYIKPITSGSYYQGINYKIGCFTKSKNITATPNTRKVESSDILDDNEETGLLKFDASSSNSIYGNSTTVQPPALVINIWKRTA